MSALSTALCPKTGLLQVLLDVAGVTLNEIARGVTDAFVKNGTLNAVAATELRKILLLHGDSRRRSISTGEGGNGQSSSRLKQSLRGGNDNRARKYSRSEQDDDFALGKGKSRLHAQMALCDCHVGRRDGGRGGRRPLPRIDHRLSSVCHDHALQVKVAGTLCHTRGRLSQGPAVGNCCTRPCAGSIRGPCADAPDPPLPAPFPPPSLSLPAPSRSLSGHARAKDEEEFDLLCPEELEEAADVLVGDFEWLDKDLVAFVRLETTLDMRLERHAQARFLVFVVGPAGDEAHERHIQMGEAAGALLQDEVVVAAAYAAHDPDRFLEAVFLTWA